MAIYHFSAKIIGRGSGRSATAAAAYRAALEIADTRTGERHDYTRKGGVLDHAVLAPARAPEWAREAGSLWNAVEQFEKRKDAQLTREIVLALPHELSLEQNREMLHAYVKEAFVARGMAAQVDIHAPDREGDKRNIHAHILLTTRQITRDGFKAQKARNWNQKATLIQWREQWAGHVNRALERAGKSETVDGRSFKDQGIEERAPTSHLGPAASEMERRGEASRIGDENRAAKSFNALQEKAKVIDLQIEREKRRLAAEEQKKKAAQSGQQEKGKQSDTQTRRKSAGPVIDRDRQTAASEQRIIDAAMELAKRRESEKPARAGGGRTPGQAPYSELWANERRAALQNLQRDERGDLLFDQARAVIRHEEKMEDAYGASEKAWRQRLAQIERRQETGGLLYKLRHAEAERQEAAGLRRNLEAAAERRAQENQRFEARQAEQSKELEERFTGQWSVLERAIEQAREASEPEPEPERSETGAEDTPSLSERFRQAREEREARDRVHGRERDRGFDRER